MGIRLGYYTQALSVWAANLWVPREAHFLHSVNILFIIAMIIGIGYLSHDPGNIYAIANFIQHRLYRHQRLPGDLYQPSTYERPQLLRARWV